MNTDTVRTWRIIRMSLALLLVHVSFLSAQEAFPPTHTLAYIAQSNGAISARGVGIARFDREARSLTYRISFGSEQAITTAWLLRFRYHHDSEADPSYDTLRTIAIAPTGATLTGTIAELDSAIINAIDAGTAELHFGRADRPEQGMGSSLQIVPSAEALSLSTSEEPTSTVGAVGAGGRAQITVDRSAHAARYTVRWYGLSGRPTAAEFHRGARGVTGPPIHSITIGSDSTSIGTWTGMSDADLEALARGEIYANIQTALNPNGEIRAQLNPVEVFVAAIEPSNQVPPVEGSTLSGTGVVILQSASGAGRLLTARTVAGPVNVTSARIHRGARGTEGTMMVELLDGGLGSWQIEEEPITSAADLALIRSGNTYLTYQTSANSEGEARGQLIPSESNLTGIPASAVPPETEPPASAAIGARIDPRNGAIHFSIAPEFASGSRRIVLFDMTGSRVAAMTAEGNDLELDSRALPGGLYIAELFVDGRMAGTTRIIIE